MKDDCLKLYKDTEGGIPKKNKSIDDLFTFTDKAIKEEEGNYNYCKNLLNQLEDENYYTVLYLRYFKDLIIEEAAEEMFYTIGYINVLTAKAVKELERIEQIDR